ncbi:MAG TPA: ABC transporter permease [Vicinamibacteria bacterium]|nr:ABC transporter permease [Vicinamibacteria bacterium]
MANPPRSPVEAVGRRVLGLSRSLGDAVGFLGSIVLALARRRPDGTWRLSQTFAATLMEAGPGSLPLVGTLAFVMGGVLLLVASDQLDKLGATLLAPNLVAIVILREIGSLMTGFALAGRLASAHAAEIASHLKLEALTGTAWTATNELVDRLVVPRVLALVVMAPLLVVYASALGLLGSLVVAVGLLDMPPGDYVERTRAALSLKPAIAGLVKGVTYGFLIAVAGGYHGLRGGSSGRSVGKAVKNAVVTAVLGVGLADAALTIFFKYVRL